MEVPTGQFLTVPGGRLFFEKVGEGRPLVFIHGFALDSRMWTHQREALKGNYQIVSYDVRGFGRSSVPRSDDYFHWQDLLFLINHTCSEPPILIGLSMGGRIACQFAVECPTSLAGLALVNSSLSDFEFTSYAAVTSSVREAFVGGGVADAKLAWLNSALWHHLSDQPELLSKVQEMTEGYSGWHWERSASFVPPLEREVRYRFDEIKVPTLVIGGGRDLEDFRTIARILADRIAGARLVELPEVGHLSPLEAPARVTQLLRTFAEGVFTGQRADEIS
jgi:pimeloyl-ACP methyl ester carboxylesterase